MQSRVLHRYNLLSVLERLGRFVSSDAPTVLFPIPTVEKKSRSHFVRCWKCTYSQRRVKKYYYLETCPESFREQMTNSGTELSYRALLSNTLAPAHFPSPAIFHLMHTLESH